MKLTNSIGLAILALLITAVATPASTKSAAPKSVVLSKDNLIVLTGEVNGESVGDVIGKAKELNSQANSGLSEKLADSKKPLYLFINSPGGSIQAGLELIEALKGLGRPVNTVTLFAASMGFQIVQNLDQRYILKSGVLMSHHATGESAGEFGGSVRTQMENRNQLWLDRIKELDEQTVKRTNGKQTYDSYTKQYDHEFWLTGTKSVEQGYADEAVLIKCDSSLDGYTTHSTVVPLFNVTVSYDLDNCPLNTSPTHLKVGGAAPDGKITVTLTEVQVDEVKRRFLENYTSKAKQVIPMYW